ncbi:MAG: type II secretion system protein [Gemmatimonadales bacterium]
MNRRGFSFIELMVALVVFGILVNLAVPAITTVQRKADAVHVIADFGAIRTAAMDRYAADGAFPPSDSWGQVPPRMVGSLPAGFAFRYKTLQYRWRSRPLRSRRGGRASQPALLGLEVRGRTRDRALMAAIRGIYRGPILFNSPTELTLIIE